MPRILLADREPFFLHGLRTTIEEQASFQIVGEVDASQQVLDLLSLHKPHLLLMGLRLSCGRDALGLAPEIRTSSQETATIVLLPRSSAFLTGRLFSSGIRGILARCTPPEVLLPAIEKVLAGEVCVDPSLTGLPSRSDSTAAQAAPSILTTRELEIFHLIGSEKSYRDIASLLGISTKTVERHRENIKTKLHLGSACALHLVAKAHLLWESSGGDYVI